MRDDHTATALRLFERYVVASEKQAENMRMLVLHQQRRELSEAMAASEPNGEASESEGEEK